MRLGLDYINAVLINEQTGSYLQSGYKDTDYLVAKKN